jgi:cysteine desulfuration protein SufE
MDFKKTKAKELLEEFLLLTDWEERYLILIQLGKLLPVLPEIKKPENIVDGCSSRVWLSLEIDSGSSLVDIKINSDSVIVSGLMTILLLHLDQIKKQDILDFKFSQLDYLQLSKHLSITRQNGFLATFKKIKQLLLTL